MDDSWIYCDRLNRWFITFCVFYGVAFNWVFFYALGGKEFAIFFSIIYVIVGFFYFADADGGSNYNYCDDISYQKLFRMAYDIVEEAERKRQYTKPMGTDHPDYGYHRRWIIKALRKQESETEDN